MGLAPYGKPIYLNLLRKILNLEEDGTFFLNLTFFRHHNEKVSYEWKGGEPKVGDLFNAEMLENHLGFVRRGKNNPLEQHHKDLACSIQAMYEEAFFNLLNYCHEKYGVSSLTLAGGCAMNSVANGKIKLRSPFDKIYVQAAAGDAGGAIGAAMTIWNELAGIRPKPMEHVFGSKIFC